MVRQCGDCGAAVLQDVGGCVVVVDQARSHLGMVIVYVTGLLKRSGRAAGVVVVSSVSK